MRSEKELLRAAPSRPKRPAARPCEAMARDRHAVQPIRPQLPGSDRPGHHPAV